MDTKKLISKIYKMKYWNCINNEVFYDFRKKNLFSKCILFRKFNLKNIDENIDLYYIYSKHGLRVIAVVDTNNLIEFFTNIQFYLHYKTIKFKKIHFNNYIILCDKNIKISGKDFELSFIDEYIIRICSIFNINLKKN